MRILAIESSCDDTAAAVVENGRKVLSRAVASQVSEHIVYGGVVPEIASRRHTESISAVVKKAVNDAGLTLGSLDAVAVTYAPGLIGALLVGVNYAKGLSYGLGIPLIPVHHLRSHIAANYLTYPQLEPPFLCLVVSGGHSHIVEVKGYTDFCVVGRTRDDAAGEALDKAARAMGLPYPGGLNLDVAARYGNPDAYKFPRPRVDSSEYDFSFSGLKTSVINLIHNASQKGEVLSVEDVGASFMNSVARLLTDNTVKAAENLGYKNIALAGGVSANSVLRKKMQAACDSHGWKLFMPELSLCGDNGAMVGAQGYYEFLSGHTAGLELNACASMTIDSQ